VWLRGRAGRRHDHRYVQPLDFQFLLAVASRRGVPVARWTGDRHEVYEPGLDDRLAVLREVKTTTKRRRR
jgi:hypothetical protein